MALQLFNPEEIVTELDISHLVIEDDTPDNSIKWVWAWDRWRLTDRIDRSSGYLLPWVFGAIAIAATRCSLSRLWLFSFSRTAR